MQTASSSLRVLRLLGAALLLVLGAAGAPASTGTIAGRVTDAYTQLALPGARVSAGGVETYSSVSGDFVLAGVPAGAQEVEVSYVGYAPLQLAATVTAGGTVRLDAVFNADVVRLERFVIEGSVVGTARAINRQRAAATLTSIVAADEIGRFPDQNAAESIQRLPGVSLYRDQGEGRFINLRGLNYIYTSVRLNGANLASPELGDRAMALDVLPADSLGSIEVTKVPTPDMDAEGLGGNVNLKTKSAFDSTGRELNATTAAIYSALTGKFNPKLNAYYSDVFADGTVGLSAGVTWQERDFGSHNFEEDGYALRSVATGTPGFLIPSALGFRDYVINRERFGVNAGLEFKPDGDTFVYFRGAHNRFTDTEDRHQTYLPFSRGALLAVSAGSATFDNISRVRRDLRIREKDQEVTGLSAGFERQAGAWKLDGQVAWSEGTERRPDELTTRFRMPASDSDLRYTFTGLYDIRLEQLGGVSVLSPANYTALDRLERANNSGSETETSLALNARLDLDRGSPAYLKFGGSFRAKEKESDVNLWRYGVPATFTFANLSQPANADYPYGFAVPRLSNPAVKAAFFGNRSAFTETVLQPDSVLEDWQSTEDVLAAYAMAGITAGRASWIAGLRYERTEFDTRGNQARGAAITPTTAARSYDHVLPGVHLRYDFSQQLVGRASYSQSLVRPAFGETAIFRNILDNDTDVEAGNPALATLESRNFDASLEYYLPSLGVLSAGLFHKQIENFSYAVTIPNGDASLPGYDLITFRNGSDGEVSGVELGYQQQLRMLPAPFDGLGLMANLTLVDSEATYPTRPGESLPFIGQSDVTGNAAVTFEKGRLFLRLALNWRDAHLREDEPIGGNSDEDRWIDDFHQLDLSAAYKLGRHLEVFAEFTNLTNEPFRVYFNSSNGQGRRFVQLEEYDWTANFGVRWKL
jgi:TonB-dependent receptor